MEKQIGKKEWDDLEERSFLKMKANMKKNGYREGVEEGRNTVFQKYFDDGYKDGFKNGFSLGKLKGTIQTQQPNSTEGLAKTSIGACILCKNEKNMSLPISKIVSDQMEVLQDSIFNIEQKQLL